MRAHERVRERERERERNLMFYAVNQYGYIRACARTRERELSLIHI